jgi:hypothetical protein
MNSKQCEVWIASKGKAEAVDGKGITKYAEVSFSMNGRKYFGAEQGPASRNNARYGDLVELHSKSHVQTL